MKIDMPGRWANFTSLTAVNLEYVRSIDVKEKSLRFFYNNTDSRTEINFNTEQEAKDAYLRMFPIQATKQLTGE